MRSSSEWKLMTARRPPGPSSRRAVGSACSSDSSSSLTTIRSAWKTRLAGCPSPKRRGAGMAARTTSTRSVVRSNGCSAAPADDGPGDLPREALLAVAAEDVGELALAQLVDDVGGRPRRRDVHAHVERRIGRVREAALGPVDLHARDAEVEEDRVGLDVVVGQLAEHDGEVAAQEPRLDARVPLEPLEVRAHAGVAVDGDEAPPAAEVGREQLAWPPAPKVASTTVSPGCTARSSRTSSARTGT